MSRFKWPLLVLAICLPVAALALGVRVPFLDRTDGLPRPLPVPDGDQELAWLNTTTAGVTWERFVAGVVRSTALVPGLHVEDAAAFQEQSTSVPEVVLSVAGRPGRLRIRWYKLTGETTPAQWMQALAARGKPPLAVVGGATTDRAVDLARALDAQKIWPGGDRPLLLVTTATADEVDRDDDPAARPDAFSPSQSLVGVYPQRSFRFCFTNKQMAEAVTDFVWSHPALRPGSFAADAHLAVASGAVAGFAPPPAARPRAFTVYWKDDPFSTDLSLRFRALLTEKADLDTQPIAYSVGGLNSPNYHEERAAESIIDQYRRLPPQRVLMVLPTVTAPARRLLRTVCEAEPTVRERLVAVTGDGISVNGVYRDGELAWPVAAMPVPLVLFTHNNPVGWDAPGATPPPPPGYEMRPPNGTEEVLHFAEMTRVVVEACFPGKTDCSGLPPSPALVSRADDLARRLRGRCPAFFDVAGERLGGTGEYVVVLWPTRPDAAHDGPDATLEVWKRSAAGAWEAVQEVPIDQRRVRPDAPRGSRR